MGAFGRRVFIPFEKSVSMRQDLPAQSQTSPEMLEHRAGPSKLLSRLYRDVGMAAVAAELNLRADAFEPEVARAVERGASLLAPRRSVLAA